MWKKPHKWVMVPRTKLERKWSLNVHEGKRTASEIPRKYYDVETGKFILDKMQSIKPIEWSDLYDEHYEDNHYQSRWSAENKYIPSMPKFVPKDNDFDEM
jgi:hypothetical protein